MPSIVEPAMGSRSAQGGNSPFRKGLSKVSEAELDRLDIPGFELGNGFTQPRGIRL